LVDPALALDAHVQGFVVPLPVGGPSALHRAAINDVTIALDDKTFELLSQPR